MLHLRLFLSAALLQAPLLAAVGAARPGSCLPADVFKGAPREAGAGEGLDHRLESDVGDVFLDQHRADDDPTLPRDPQGQNGDLLDLTSQGLTCSVMDVFWQGHRGTSSASSSKEGEVDSGIALTPTERPVLRGRRRALWPGDAAVVRPARLPRLRPNWPAPAAPATPRPASLGGIAGRPLLPADTEVGDESPFAPAPPAPPVRTRNPFPPEPERHVTRSGILLPPYRPEDLIAGATPEDGLDARADALRNPRKSEQRPSSQHSTHPDREKPAKQPTSSEEESEHTRRPVVEEELRKAWENIASHRVEIPSTPVQDPEVTLKVNADSESPSRKQQRATQAYPLGQQQQQQQEEQQQQWRQQQQQQQHMDHHQGPSPDQEGRMLADLLVGLARRAREISEHLQQLAETSTTSHSVPPKPAACEVSPPDSKPAHAKSSRSKTKPTAAGASSTTQQSKHTTSKKGSAPARTACPQSYSSPRSSSPVIWSPRATDDTYSQHDYRDY